VDFLFSRTNRGGFCAAPFKSSTIVSLHPEGAHVFTAIATHELVNFVCCGPEPLVMTTLWRKGHMHYHFGSSRLRVTSENPKCQYLEHCGASGLHLHKSIFRTAGSSQLDRHTGVVRAYGVQVTHADSPDSRTNQASRDDLLADSVPPTLNVGISPSSAKR